MNEHLCFSKFKWMLLGSNRILPKSHLTKLAQQHLCLVVCDIDNEVTPWWRDAKLHRRAWLSSRWMDTDGVVDSDNCPARFGVIPSRVMRCDWVVEISNSNHECYGRHKHTIELAGAYTCRLVAPFTTAASSWSRRTRCVSKCRRTIRATFLAIRSILLPVVSVSIAVNKWYLTVHK